MMSLRYYVHTMLRFIVDNSLVGAIAGVTIGFVIATAVKSLVADIFMPSLYKVIYCIMLITPWHNSSLVTNFRPLTQLKIDSFLKEAVNLSLIIVCAYIILIKVVNKYIIAKKLADEQNKRLDDRNSANANTMASLTVDDMGSDMGGDMWSDVGGDMGSNE